LTRSGGRMSSDWQKLGEDTWYRKRKVYSAHWDDEPDRLRVSVVAGAPFGGPVATVRDENVFQPVRGSLRPELQTWTSAGRPIASTPWPHTGLLTMGWSSEETLVCVFEAGAVRTFNVMCEQLHSFTVDDRIKGEGGAVLATLWSAGVALLTKRLNLFLNTSFSRSGDACYKCADLKVPGVPLCLCVLASPHEGTSADVRVIVGSAEGPVYLADRHEVRELSPAGLTEGPYMAFAVSSSGRFLACLSTKGVFKVLAVGDDMRVLDVANIQVYKKPRQMVWCGDDCIALYCVTPAANQQHGQHVLFVGGPQNEWIPYEYSTPLHLVPECDGCRILGAQTVEFVQRVPESTQAIYGVGNCDPPAMLCYALERYEKGDVCAQESLKLIKDDLGDAVATCIDAAVHEHEPEVVESLLNAAVFGRHFLAEPADPERFIDACRRLRICLEVRKAPLEVPLTVPQLDRLTARGLAQRLAWRHHHFLAARICEWVGEPKGSVLLHWACEKIKHARGSAETDEQLSKAILAKLRGGPGSGHAEVARVAAENHRPRLATMLLEHEPCGHAQVEVLLQLSREGGDSDSSQMMLKLAIEKAAQSHDPDLLYSTVSAACGGHPCGRACDVQGLARLVREAPQELQAVGDVFVAILHRGEQFDRARSFHEQLGKSRQAAFSMVQQVFRKRDPLERAKWLRLAKDCFEKLDAGAPEPERLSAQFCAQACTEEADLLKKQEELEAKSVSKRWLDGPHRFCGLSLVGTLSKLIALQESGEADTLRAEFKISDRRYWRIKVQALADAGNLDELNIMATQRTSPVGHELVIEAFLRHRREDLARPFVAKVRDFAQQAAYYDRMGMREEAQAAREQASQQRAGPGRLLQSILGR